jgi:hypothetical protein
MQTYLDCYPCALRQALQASQMAGATPEQKKQVIQATLKILQDLPDGATPPEIGTQVHAIVRELTGHQDPYHQVKAESTQKALSLLPKLRQLVAEAADPLEEAIRISIAGNIIDFGPNPNYDLWEVVERVRRQPLAIDKLDELRASIDAASSILYLGDNAGETVFDRVLIETLDKPVTYVVRGGPVLNDVTLEDALAVGLDEVAEIMDNGARVPGTALAACSPAFQARFAAAELILAKGMGNYETLSTVDAPIFFLLQVKCPVIGDDLGVPERSVVVAKGPLPA